MAFQLGTARERLARKPFLLELLYQLSVSHPNRTIKSRGNNFNDGNQKSRQRQLIHSRHLSTFTKNGRKRKFGLVSIILFAVQHFTPFSQSRIISCSASRGPSGSRHQPRVPGLLQTVGIQQLVQYTKQIKPQVSLIALLLLLHTFGWMDEYAQVVCPQEVLVSSQQAWAQWRLVLLVEQQGASAGDKESHKHNETILQGDQVLILRSFNGSLFIHVLK